ncbi:MAG: branched-chain amino acid ABC transporter permease [Chloroflexi bacterium]|nr:MAG: branched-chain amino acid ABC transporter permease [Chloroflexota bacterium]MBL1195061.1 branched-chain amino acid ABC transporter permease [Chloroflexota bacterium]NOH12349.1 branched-chain amino acid ABC transporter permease [Chloroflexota bacterium]
MKRVLIVIAVGFLLAVLPFIVSGYWLGLITQAVILGGFAMGLDLLVGFARMPSIGHSTFFGLSGYGVALAVTRFDVAIWPAVGIGLLLSLIAALLFGPLAVRMRGLAFLTITLAFGQLTWGLTTRWSSFTNGENGIPGISRPSFLWDIETVVGYFYFTLLIAIAISIFIIIFAESPVGISLLGVRNSDTRMSALGYNIHSRRTIAFVVAAAVGAMYGILNVFYNKFIGPGSLSWQLSAQMLLSVVVGGPVSLWGPFLAGSGIVILKTMLIGTTQRWPMVLGLLYVVSVVFLPGGIASLLPKVRARFEKMFRGRVTE